MARLGREQASRVAMQFAELLAESSFAVMLVSESEATGSGTRGRGRQAVGVAEPWRGRASPAKTTACPPRRGGQRQDRIRWLVRTSPGRLADLAAHQCAKVTRSRLLWGGRSPRSAAARRRADPGARGGRRRRRAWCGAAGGGQPVLPAPVREPDVEACRQQAAAPQGWLPGAVSLSDPTNTALTDGRSDRVIHAALTGLITVLPMPPGRLRRGYVRPAGWIDYLGHHHRRRHGTIVREHLGEGRRVRHRDRNSNSTGLEATGGNHRVLGLEGDDVLYGGSGEDTSCSSP